MQELISTKNISRRVTDLGNDIRRCYDGRPLTMVGIMKGSFIFLADLIRAVGRDDAIVDFLAASSYGSSTTTSGEVRITSDLTSSIEGRHVVVVEDIVDTGLTISHVLSVLRTRNPASVAVCALLHKPSRKRMEVPIDFLGFTIEDKFVVGYGLDFDGKFRSLPYVGVYDGS